MVDLSTICVADLSLPAGRQAPEADYSMSIRFNCPNCDELIAFDDKHCGKRARCLNCGQFFIIPSKDNEKPKKIEPKIEKGVPLPGFYSAVFVDSWKLFINPENITSLVFVVAAVCFKFFLARGICCLNYISFAFVWGWLLGFYLNIIYETAFEIDKLPEIYLGTSITFLWYVIKPFLIFFATMVVVQFPFIIALMLLQDKGITYENMWQERTGFYLLLQVFLIFGLFLFPMAILTTAVGKDITLLRPDYFLVPIFRAFLPYTVVVFMLAVFAILEMQTTQYTSAGLATTVKDLTLNFAIQVVAIIAMRSIGLFYRHYSCFLPW